MTDIDEDWDGPEPCDHEDYTVDIVNGRAECDRCPHSWYVGNEEVLRAIDAQAAYDQYLDRENRKDWWRGLFAPVLKPISDLRWRFQRWRLSRGCVTIPDDDIPF